VFGSMVAGGGRLGRVEPFVPLRPVPRGRLILRAVMGRVVWLVALLQPVVEEVAQGLLRC
jgi:hypothetical protein